MKRQRRIKRKRKSEDDLIKYSTNEVRSLILKFLEERLTPEKHGFGEIIYNNSIPFLNVWITNNKKK